MTAAKKEVKREMKNDAKNEVKRDFNKGSKGISVSKNDNFSEWYTEVVQKCELADLRYNVKGFLVFQPWSVLAMEKMFR